MCEVSKKKEKIKQMFELATGCTALYGSGKRCQKFMSCREGCDIKHKATGTKNGLAVIDADL